MFFKADTSELAIRDITRKVIGFEDGYAQAYSAIGDRIESDASRPNDSVIPDDDAFDYWRDEDAKEYTLFRYCLEHDLKYADASDYLTALEQIRSTYRVVRRGMGFLSAVFQRQVLFDTGEFRPYLDPLQAMLDASDILLDEALATIDLPDTRRAAYPEFRTSTRPSEFFAFLLARTTYTAGLVKQPV